MQCVVPENVPAFRKEEIFDNPPPPPCLEIELKLQTFLELFFSFETPSPHCGISNLFYLVGGWIFSGTTQIRVYARISRGLNQLHLDRKTVLQCKYVNDTIMHL